jgi:hypothetical protein
VRVTWWQLAIWRKLPGTKCWLCLIGVALLYVYYSDYSSICSLLFLLLTLFSLVYLSPRKVTIRTCIRELLVSKLGPGHRTILTVALTSPCRQTPGSDTRKATSNYFSKISRLKKRRQFSLNLDSVEIRFVLFFDCSFLLQYETEAYCHV